MQDYFWKVFHKYYNLICIFICTPICTKNFILAKSGCYKRQQQRAAHRRPRASTAGTRPASGDFMHRRPMRGQRRPRALVARAWAVTASPPPPPRASVARLWVAEASLVGTPSAGDCGSTVHGLGLWRQQPEQGRWRLCSRHRWHTRSAGSHVSDGASDRPGITSKRRRPEHVR
jgi:hypothetical protein